MPHENEMRCRQQELLNLLKRSERVWAFTGAGVSTLSGIRDFRGTGGVYTTPWHGLSVEEILSIDCFLEHPDYFYEWALEFVYCAGRFRPSIVHTVLARMERAGLLKGIVTQNIDILHQAAGSRTVLEVHGSAADHTCLSCGKKFPYREIEPIVQAHQVPHCPSCRGLVKPDIIFYGEQLNERVLEDSFQAMENCDCVLTLGSSLVVQPAASLPEAAFRAGAKLVIVNAGETPLDRCACIRLEDLGSTFEYLDRNLSDSGWKK